MVLLDERKNPNRPWLTKTAVSILHNLIKKTDFLVETGSGRSSLWFAERCGMMISLEHNKDWYNKISNENSNDENWSKVEYHLEEDFEQYINRIKNLDNKSVDILLVDGIERSTCALHGFNKVKSGGLIIVDNINWFIPSDSKSPNSIKLGGSCKNDEWKQFDNLVSGFRRIWTTNGVTDTCIWFINHD